MPSLAVELAERKFCPHTYWQAASSGSSSYEATQGGLYLAFGENKLKLHIIFENIKEQILRIVNVNGFSYCND